MTLAMVLRAIGSGAILIRPYESLASSPTDEGSITTLSGTAGYATRAAMTAGAVLPLPEMEGVGGWVELWGAVIGLVGIRTCALSRSTRCTRPPGPEPMTVSMSMPMVRASLRTAGDAGFRRPRADVEDREGASVAVETPAAREPLDACAAEAAWPALDWT